MKKCSRCGLVNPDTSTRCDCGLEFTVGETHAQRGQRLQLLAEAHAQMRQGGALAGLGIFVSLMTLIAAARGRSEFFLLWTGLIVWGVGRFARGWSAASRLKDQIPR